MLRALIITALVMTPCVASAQTTYAQNSYSAWTIGTGVTAVLSANSSKVFLDFVNPSASATIACAPGSITPAINGAGSITIPPQWHRSWEGSFIPSDSWSCTASVASTPMTVGAK